MQPGDRPQPARAIILARELKMHEVAKACGVSRPFLRDVLYGRCPVGNKVRARLPELLGATLEELFDEDLIKRGHGPKGERDMEIIRRGMRGENKDQIARDYGLSTLAVRKLLELHKWRETQEPTEYVRPSEERNAEICRRRAEGETVRSIAHAFGITTARVYEIVHANTAA